MRVAPAVACVAVVAACLGATSSAHANGRFPFASQLVVDPGDATHIVLRTTYGLVQSVDGGKSWQWLCEKSVGYGGQLDPAIAVTAGGTLLAGVFDGLSVSTDRACSWAYAPGILDKQYVIDVSVLKSAPKSAVALTSTGATDAGFFVVVAASKDDGKTWTQQGAAIPDDFTSETLDVAPSNPKRIYVSGFHGTPHVAAIERSDDDGASWQRLDIPLANGAAPYIAAIDPTDADVVYVRVDLDGPDALLVTRDAGKTWSNAYGAKGDLLGFALSPDGSRVALGGTKDGLRVAGKGDLAFVKTSDVATRCLTWTKDGLFVCASEFPDGFTAAVTIDEGKTYTPLYHLTDLTQLSCPAGTSTARECPSQWDNVVLTLGIGDDAGPLDDAGPADTGKPPGKNPVGPAPASGGCGCGLVGVTAPLGGGLAASLALLAVAARRRRRSGLRSHPVRP